MAAYAGFRTMLDIPGVCVDGAPVARNVDFVNGGARTCVVRQNSATFRVVWTKDRNGQVGTYTDRNGYPPTFFIGVESASLAKPMLAARTFRVRLYCYDDMNDETWGDWSFDVRLAAGATVFPSRVGGASPQAWEWDRSFCNGGTVTAYVSVGDADARVINGSRRSFSGVSSFSWTFQFAESRLKA